MKHNYKMKISYDGTRYYGWEHQPNQEMTIQGKLETVLEKMLISEQNLTIAAENDASDDASSDISEAVKKKVTVIGAGRTDAGVHAREMTANVILDTEMTEKEIQGYMNRYLPDDISVNELKICADRFHSRFKAKGKTYCYSCWYSDEGMKPVFDRRYVAVLDKMPDVSRMREAAGYLIGMHDYKSFCGNSHMKKSTTRVIDSIEIKTGHHYIRMTIHGNGFLQNMVRIIMGTLLEAGYGDIEPSDVKNILEAKDRSKAGPTAPAKGLTLISVDY